MLTENTAYELRKLVKTTENKVLLINQAHNLLTDLSKVTPPSAQEIQKNYPFLFKILQECFPETSKKLEQKDLEHLLSQLDSLKVVTFYIPNAVTSDSIYNNLSEWVMENIAPTLLVNCLPAVGLLAGITVSYEGHFVNLSLDKIVKEKVYA